LLFDNLRAYLSWSYDRLHALVGNEHNVEVQCTSGARYDLQVDVAPVDETVRDLEVEGIISQAGRRWFPAALSASLVITMDRRVSSQTQELIE
jgi:hypothetical protein